MQKMTAAFVIILLLFNFTAYSEIIADNDMAVKNIATPILDNILKGITNNDYAVFSRDFDSQMQKSVPARQFKITCDQIFYKYGKYKFKQYMCYYNQQKMTVVLYKAKFDKSIDDVLIKLAVTRDKNKYLVTGFWIQ